MPFGVLRDGTNGEWMDGTNGRNENADQHTNTNRTINRSNAPTELYTRDTRDTHATATVTGGRRIVQSIGFDA